MAKEKDYREWFNYIIKSVNSIVFYDLAFKVMMTTVYDPIIEEYIYFNRVKRPSASLKYLKAAESANSSFINFIKSLEPMELTDSINSINSINSIELGPIKGG